MIRKMHNEFGSENLTEYDHLGALGIDGRITLI
jgi:hypothetical protein